MEMPISLKYGTIEEERIMRRGWVEQPNQRGTLDIMWACVTTLATCCWVMLHLNVPAETDSLWTITVRKARWFFLALLAPELVMLFACGQWASARRSVTDMRAAGYHQWTIVHAFYADSGGFVLQAPDCKAFPVTAKQMHYLLHKRYLKAPMISRREIWDKSKADLFAKLVASFQAIWLVAQVIARAIQGLPVTLLEVSTVALITCAGFTIYFWFQKPLDVEVPTLLTIDIPIAAILIGAGVRAKVQLEDTPLDFIEPRVYTSSQLPYGKNWSIRKRPLPRLPNDRDSRLYNLRSIIMVAIPMASFTCLHLVAWNFDFPTRDEQLLWRWTCISMGIILGTGCLVEASSIVWDGYTTSGLTTLKSYKLKWPTNILFFVPGLLYVSARLIVIIEVIISLRQLPHGCFDVVRWSELFPHL